MPNLCENELRVKGNREKLRSFSRFAQARFSREDSCPLDFNQFVPYPGKLLESDRSIAIEWIINKWGTNRNALDVHLYESDKQLLYCFYTAWTPPAPIVLAMSRSYPTLTFILKYQERGFCFHGRFEAKNGKVLRDEDKDYHLPWRMKSC